MGNNKSETSSRKQIRFYKDRASYSFTSAKEIFLQSPIAHVAFLHPCGTLLNVPLILVIIPDPYIHDDNVSIDLDQEDEDQFAVYLHTHLHSGLVEAVKKGFDSMTATCTIVDGIVFSPTPHDHSLNYRSATLHLNEARLLSQDMNDEEIVKEKRLALESVVEIATGQINRTIDVGKPTDESLKHTAIIKCKISNFSCKQRHGGWQGNKPVTLQPFDKQAKEDEKDNAFKGVVPCWTEYGNAIGYGKGKEKVQEALKQRSNQFSQKVTAIAHSQPEGILQNLGGKPI